MKKNRIFREERPGEKKSIVTLLLTGYVAVISILGYTAFYLNIQLGQLDRILSTLDRETLSNEQFNFVKSSLARNAAQLQNEIIWIAIFGSAFSLIGGGYTYNLVVRPLRKLVRYVEEGNEDPPQINTNNELKQLVTAIDALNARHGSHAIEEKQLSGD